jgi:hypothetical protein
MLVYRFVLSSILKMEATCSSETSVDFHWTTQRYNPEARYLHSHALLFTFSYNIHPLHFHEKSTIYKLTTDKYSLRNRSVFEYFLITRKKRILFTNFALPELNQLVLKSENTCVLWSTQIIQAYKRTQT